MALDEPSGDDRARREMKWWGWGDPDHRPELPDHAVAFLRSEVGIAVVVDGGHGGNLRGSERGRPPAIQRIPGVRPGGQVTE